MPLLKNKKMNNFITKYKPILLKIKRFVNSKIKYDLVKYPTPEFKRKILLLKHYNIDVVLDVGANIGQYGSELLNLGYKGVIHSFEPLSEAYYHLRKISNNYQNWHTHHTSLGSYNGNAQINVAKNSVSSSLLNPLPELLSNEPRAETIRVEKVQIQILDSVFDHLVQNNESVFLKIDAQGYEKHILEGAKQSLKKIKGLQIEMSLKPSYQNSPSFEEVVELLKNYNFELVSIEPGFYDPKTGVLLEVDGFFIKNNEE